MWLASQTAPSILDTHSPAKFNPTPSARWNSASSQTPLSTSASDGAGMRDSPATSLPSSFIRLLSSFELVRSFLFLLHLLVPRTTLDTEQTGRMANWVLKMRCCLLFVTTVLRLALNQCTFCFLVQGDRRKKESFTERLLLARHRAGCLRFIPLLTSTTTLRQSVFVFLLYVQTSWLKEVG